MRWDSIEYDLLKRAAIIPGGTGIVDAMVELLELEPEQQVLDLNPGTGILPAMVAREFEVEITCVTSDSPREAAIEATAAALGVSGKVKVFPGTPAELPLPSEEFHRIYYIGQPFPPPTTHGVVREMYRVLAPDGMVGTAGPAALLNRTPDYMADALKEIQGVTFRTPAYTALMFAQEGFHIVTAEFYSELYDYWKTWVNEAPEGAASAEFKRAVAEDSGRWLALGLIVLRKPPKPNWAM